MSNATMSILGLWNADHSIFNNLNIPAGINKSVLVNELMAQCAEFEILYPEPDFMKAIIGSWSKASLYKWQQLYDTTQLEYDVLSNYDRKEEWTDSSNVESNPGSTQTTAQQGYENSGFVDSSKMTMGGTDTSTASSTHSGRMYGNIGVTSSMDLIRQQRQISDFNIYQIIIDDFKARFCLCIY